MPHHEYGETQSDSHGADDSEDVGHLVGLELLWGVSLGWVEVVVEEVERVDQDKYEVDQQQEVGGDEYQLRERRGGEEEEGLRLREELTHCPLPHNNSVKSDTDEYHLQQRKYSQQLQL